MSKLDMRAFDDFDMSRQSDEISGWREEVYTRPIPNPSPVRPLISSSMKEGNVLKGSTFYLPKSGAFYAGIIVVDGKINFYCRGRLDSTYVKLADDVLNFSKQNKVEISFDAWVDFVKNLKEDEEE